MRTFILKSLTLSTLLTPLGLRAQTPSLEQFLNVGSNSQYAAAPSVKGEIAFLTRTSGTGQLWKTNLNGEWPTQLTFFTEPIEPPEWSRNFFFWSPDGHDISFSINTGGAQHNQIYVVPAAGGLPAKLSLVDGAMYRLGPWSPNGKEISWASNERNSRFFDIYVYNLAAKKVRRVLESEKNLDILDWSRDGKCLLVKHLHSDIIHDLIVVDVVTGKETLITPHQDAAEYNGRFGTTCDEVFAITNEGTEYIGLERIDVKTATKKWLVQKQADAEGISVSPNTIAVNWNVDGYGELALYSRGGQVLSSPKLQKGLFGAPSFSTDGTYLAFTHQTPRVPNAIFTYSPARHALKQVTKPNMVGLKSKELIEPQLIKYKSFDGREIAGFLYARNGLATKNSPVVFSIHGGPEAQERPYFAGLYQYLAGQGLVVFAPNIRGSTGYGKTFNQMDNREKRPSAMRDIISGADYLVSTGIADPKKLAIEGGSYGGYAVLYMVTHFPERWAAGVDMDGIANFETYFKNTSPARVPLRALEYGDPATDSALLKELSPMKDIAKVRAPMMIIQGANDPIVPKIEAEQIVESLKKRGLPVEYLLFPDEGHGISKRQNLLKVVPAEAEFLKKYLK